MDTGVEVRTNSPARKLITTNGNVTGIEIEMNGNLTKLSNSAIKGVYHRKMQISEKRNLIKTRGGSQAVIFREIIKRLWLS